MGELFIVAAVLAGLGLLCFFAGALYWRAALRRDRRCTARVQGLVTELAATGNGARVTLCPVLRYAVDGRELTRRSGFASSRCPFTTGQQVEVRCDPQDPRVFVLEGELAHRRGLALRLALVGGGFLLLALVALASG